MNQTEVTPSQGRLRDLPWWDYLAVPAILYPLVVLSALVERLHTLYGLLMHKEGLVEWFGVCALVIGLIAGVQMMIRHRHRLPNRRLRVWFGFVLVGMLFLAGEEISWGQHMGFWTSEQVPEWFRDLNDQDETNLHNIGNALDMNLTNLATVATLVGCVIIPLYLRRKGETLTPDNPHYWFWPTFVCLPAAIGVMFIRFPQRIYRWSAGEIPVEIEAFWRHSEAHECYIAFLFTIYILSVAWRLSQMPDPPMTPVEKKA